MKTLYIDCGMGCAGDMFTAALLELHPDREAFIAKMNAALGGRAVITARADSKCGIKGTHVSVLINGDEEGAVLCHEHEPTSIAEILGFIAAAPLPDTEYTHMHKKLEEAGELDEDHANDKFHITHPDTDWKSCIDHAEKIGIGTREYELIRVK